MTITPIKTALISVTHKEGVVALAQRLSALGVHIISTGGTATLLAEQGIAVTLLESHTGFPEILDGRVKTLHPTVHGGLLAKRDNPAHLQTLQTHNIQTIDLLVVNLYAFEETVASGADEATCIEHIDIGGPAMLRSAAKNYTGVAILSDPADYAEFLQEIEQHAGATSLAFRKKMAASVFARIAAYDVAIAEWFQRDTSFGDYFFQAGKRLQTLRYGENPHQQATVYQLSNDGLCQATQLQGKELSYNNFADADAALNLVAEFTEPTVAIIKHANPCGVGRGKNLAQAYAHALAADAVSAFGGIVACNCPIDAATAQAMVSHFFEVILAPSIEPAAREIFNSKKQLRVLEVTLPDLTQPGLISKTIRGGLLVQERDQTTTNPEALVSVTTHAIPPEVAATMLFAEQIAKHVASNAIVIATNQQTLGIGAGQMSRVDAVRIACEKAMAQAEYTALQAHAVMASDAFFPFADGIELAAKAGIRYIIQPGGSVRDAEVIAAADRLGIAMVFTGTRHFRH
jgi:phosphoribosylaminoimidazolecarboxamide formyltransferase/IMP cyclohydrolase